MKYDIDLTFPKASRQPVYSITVEAPSRTAALTLATLCASQDGWKGSPIKNSVRLVQEHAA